MRRRRARTDDAGAAPARRAGTTPYLLALPALSCSSALLGYPMVRMIILSFQNMRLRELFQGLTPPWVGFDNYTQSSATRSSGRSSGAPCSSPSSRSRVTVGLLGLGIALLMRRVAPGVRIAMIVAMMFVWAMPQLVAAQIFRWMVDADFGVVNYLLDQIPASTSRTTAGSPTRSRAGSVITVAGGLGAASRSSRSP